MSVTVRVKQNSPAALPPSWPTRLISTKAGKASFHSAQVRMGIWDLSRGPGLGMEPAPDQHPGPLRGQAPVEGGRTHAHQQVRLRQVGNLDAREAG